MTDKQMIEWLRTKRACTNELDCESCTDKEICLNDYVMPKIANRLEELTSKSDSNKSEQEVLEILNDIKPAEPEYIDKKPIHNVIKTSELNTNTKLNYRYIRRNINEFNREVKKASRMGYKLISHLISKDKGREELVILDKIEQAGYTIMSENRFYLNYYNAFRISWNNNNDK